MGYTASILGQYLSLLDFITIDTRKNFISKEFKQYAVNIKIIIKGVLVKAYNLVSMVKYYYRPYSIFTRLLRPKSLELIKI